MTTKKTETARRADLEALPVNIPEGYISGRIFPRKPSKVMSSKIYYKTVVTDSAAQTDRSAGTAPVTTLITDANKTFTCTEKTKRYGVPYELIQQFGGIEKADNVGGQAAKRSVLRKLEDERAELLLTTGAPVSVANDGSDFLAKIKAGKQAVKRYKGKLVFVCSSTAFDRIMDYEVVKDRIAKFHAIKPGDNEAALGLDKQLLAMVLKVQEILVGDDDHWARTTAGTVDLSRCAALVKIAPEEEESQDMDPVFAKTVVYEPSDDGEFEITSFADDDDETNKYTAKSWVDYVVFNAGAVYVLNNIIDQA